jgi:hypothetical protein
MAGDPNNTEVWANADVYIAATSATNPTGGAAFGIEWDFVGLLSGDDGFTESNSADSTDHSAWGYGVIKTTRRNAKTTVAFTMLEDNETVFDLFYPGHAVTFTGADYDGIVNVPNLQAKFKIGLQVETDGVIRRKISRNYAQVDTRGDAKEGENDLQSRQVTCIVYPDSSQGLWDVYKGAAGS